MPHLEVSLVQRQVSGQNKADVVLQIVVLTGGEAQIERADGVQRAPSEQVAAAGDGDAGPHVGKLPEVQNLVVDAGDEKTADMGGFPAGLDAVGRAGRAARVQMQIRALDGHRIMVADDAASVDRMVRIFPHGPAEQAQPVGGDHGVVVQKRHPVAGSGFRQ